MTNVIEFFMKAETKRNNSRSAFEFFHDFRLADAPDYKVDSLDGHYECNPAKIHVPCTLFPAIFLIASGMSMPGQEFPNVLLMGYGIGILASHCKEPRHCRPILRRAVMSMTNTSDSILFAIGGSSKLKGHAW